ncbi:hypothetical protein C2G38_2179098 [Gigaspora rosea]|uniref:Uncharacterized protein n=1 Tax=Gigaspora rosea TaxID=44941 RepID=A0A397VFC0_9GLOM|nr:hypothetical protein C2G38_2179098 [Gigaspora rosea]
MVTIDFTHTLPSQGTRWTGFWCSINKKTGNRYTAKCKYCLFDLEEASKKTVLERKRIKHDQDITASEDDQEELHLSALTMQSAKQESIVNWCIKPISHNYSEKLHQKYFSFGICDQNGKVYRAVVTDVGVIVGVVVIGVVEIDID